MKTVLQNLLLKKTPVIQVPVARTRNAEMEYVLASMNTMVIHTQVAALNAFLALIVPETKPVLETNAWTPAQEPVVITHSVMS